MKTARSKYIGVQCSGSLKNGKIPGWTARYRGKYLGCYQSEEAAASAYMDALHADKATESQEKIFLPVDKYIPPSLRKPETAKEKKIGDKGQ